MPGRNEPFPWAGLIDIGAVTGFAAALLYTAGWSYAYHYFAQFQIGLLGIAIQREYFFLYGFWVLKAHPFCVLLCLGGCAGLYFLLRFFWQRAQAGPAEQTEKRLFRLRVAAFVGGSFCLLLLFIWFSWFGAATGRAVFEREQAGNFADYPRVKVWLTGKQNERAEAWAGGCYQLLLRDKNNLYLFLAQGVKNRMPTEIIPSGRVAAVRVIPWYESSDECR